MKILPILLMSAFALSACGQKTVSKNTSTTGEIVPEEGAVLKFWETGWNAEKSFIDYAALEFQKLHPGVSVKVETVQLGSMVNRVSQDIPAGVGPDIFAAPHDQIGQLVSAGLIMENLVSAEGIRADFHPAAVAAVSKDEKIYGFPVNMETYALLYNKKIFSTIPSSFEEFIPLGKGFTDKKQNKYALVWALAELYYFHAFLAADGGYIFGKGGTDPSDLGLNNAGAIRGIKNMLSLKPLSVDNASDATIDAMYGIFGESKAGAMITGPWSIESVKKMGIPFGIAPLPTFAGKRPISLAGVVAYQVSSFSKYPKAAQLFSQFITSKDMLRERFKRTLQIPPNKALLEEPEIKGHEYIGPFLVQLDSSVPMPSIPEMGLLWTPAKAAASDIWNGKVSVEEGLNALQANLKTQINR